MYTEGGDVSVGGRILGCPRQGSRGSRGPISGGGGRKGEERKERKKGKKWLDILIERVFIYRPYSSAISDRVARPGGDRSPLSRRSQTEPPPHTFHPAGHTFAPTDRSMKIKLNGTAIARDNFPWQFFPSGGSEFLWGFYRGNIRKMKDREDIFHAFIKVIVNRSQFNFSK